MSPCLLLVHDSVRDAAVVAEVASSLGMTLLHARPAAESLKLFGTRRPAWVLLCPSAEGGRGARLLAELRRHPYGGRARFLLLGEGLAGSDGDDVEPLPLDARRLAERLARSTQRGAIAAAARNAATQLKGADSPAPPSAHSAQDPLAMPTGVPPAAGPGATRDSAQRGALPRADADSFPSRAPVPDDARPGPFEASAPRPLSPKRRATPPADAPSSSGRAPVVDDARTAPFAASVRAGRVDSRQGAATPPAHAPSSPERAPDLHDAPADPSAPVQRERAGGVEASPPVDGPRPPRALEIGRLAVRIRQPGAESVGGEPGAMSELNNVAGPMARDEALVAPAPLAPVLALPPRLEPGAGEAPPESFARRLAGWAADGRPQRLHLEDEDGRGRWLWLEHGRVVAASSSVPAESLLERARLDGLVTAAELTSLRDLRRAGAAEQLAALRARGWVRDDEAGPLLSRHLRAVALEALAAPGIRFDRAPADKVPDEVPRVHVPVPAVALVVEALRRRSVAASVLERVGGLGARVVPVPHALPHADLQLSARELTWWEGWEAGGGTVEALLLGAGLREEAAVGLLAALETLGALEFHPPELRAPATLGIRELDRLEAKLKDISRADYFEVLGLPRTAGTGEVLRAWETLRAEFEPLKYVGHPDAGLVRDAQEVCAALDEAVKALRDDRLRAAYARFLVG